MEGSNYDPTLVFTNSVPTPSYLLIHITSLFNPFRSENQKALHLDAFRSSLMLTILCFTVPETYSYHIY